MAAPGRILLLFLLFAALAAPSWAGSDDLDSLLGQDDPLGTSDDLGALPADLMPDPTQPTQPTKAATGAVDLDLGGGLDELSSSPPLPALTGTAQEVWSLLQALSVRVRARGFRPVPEQAQRALQKRLGEMAASVAGPLAELARKRSASLAAAAGTGTLAADAAGLEEALDSPARIGGAVGASLAGPARAAQEAAYRQEDRADGRLDGLLYAPLPATESAAAPAQVDQGMDDLLGGDDAASAEKPLSSSESGADARASAAAQEDLQRLLRPVASRGADVFAEAGSRHTAAGRHDLAADCFARASLLEPANPVHAYCRAKALYRQGLFSSALSESERALCLGPVDRRYYALQIGCLRALGRATEVAALVKDALRGAEGGGLRAFLYCQLAGEELADGRAGEALGLLKLARAGFVPAELEAKQACLTAEALLAEGHADRSLAVLEQARGLGVSSARLERQLARLRPSQ